MYEWALSVRWLNMPVCMSVILINTEYAIQMERELAILKIQLDGVQEQYDNCQNRWQDIHDACAELKKRKAYIRVFGKIREMHERGYAGIWNLIELTLRSDHHMHASHTLAH
jgi:hypothetical protein